MGTQYAKDNLSSSNNNLHIDTDSQTAIKAIIGQNRESYHKNTKRNVWENLMRMCQMIHTIKLVYCPVHKGILDNETADSLTKVASKKAKYLLNLTCQNKRTNIWHYKNGKGEEKIRNTTNINKCCHIIIQ